MKDRGSFHESDPEQRDSPWMINTVFKFIINPTQIDQMSQNSVGEF